MGDPQPLGAPLGRDPLLFTPEEAAKLLRVGRTTIYSLMKVDELRPVHIGRSCRISRAELERYVRRLDGPQPSALPRPRRQRPTSTNQHSLFEVSSDSVDGA
jgi:excisionase family DNA binding protein